MKLQFCFLVMVTGSLSCEHDGTTQPQATPAKVCQIHLQSWFSNTPVFVSVDQTQIFADTVSTGYAIAVAAVIPVQVNQGTHKLGVNIANFLFKDTSFTIYDSLYVGVHYDSANAVISYRFQRNPFVYR